MAKPGEIVPFSFTPPSAPISVPPVAAGLYDEAMEALVAETLAALLRSDAGAKDKADLIKAWLSGRAPAAEDAAAAPRARGRDRLAATLDALKERHAPVSV